MICLNCHKKFNIEVTIKNLFKKQYSNICDECFIKFDMINHFDIIPIDNAVLINYTIFELKHIKDVNALSEFIVPYIAHFIKNHSDDLLYISDKNNNEIQEMLLKLNLGNIHHIILYQTKQRRIL